MKRPYTSLANALGVRKVLVLLILLALLLLAVGIASAQSGGGLAITRWTVGGGSGTSTGGSYVVRGTAEQLDAGTLSGGVITLHGGFWHGAQTQPPCTPVSGVHLSRTPSGDIFTGSMVRFTADASGSTPFTTTWTLDGAPVGGNQSTFEYTFNITGTFAVSATVTNACGQGSDSLAVTVQPVTPGQPALEVHKLVNLTNVETGDILTYTLMLQNNNAVTATALLTDPLPVHTVYVPGSAQASDGVTVTISDGQIHWAGQIISGTPVVIQFAAQIPPTETMPVGTVVTNVVYLDDGLGHVTSAGVQSLYNPGYRLTVNEGALYTNIPTVTLRYAWNVADPITHVKFSNDGGFGPAGNTTDWLPVNSSEPTYVNWVLATYGDLRMPRTVYARFRDGFGRQYGPVQDDIIYDPVSPQVTGVEIITQTMQGLRASGEQNVVVRVAAGDDNSGVIGVQLSHSADMSQLSEFVFAGPTIDISWTLQPSGVVYVRAVDRAGNLSSVVGGQGTAHHEVYLPLVVRQSP